MKAIIGSCVEVSLSVGEKRDSYFSSSYFLIPCDLFEFPGVVCKRCKFLEKINFRDNAQKPFDRDIQLSLDSNGNFFGLLIDFIEHFDAIFLLKGPPKCISNALPFFFHFIPQVGTCDFSYSVASQSRSVNVR